MPTPDTRGRELQSLAGLDDRTTPDLVSWKLHGA
jgi:hypothetical protein